MDASEELLYRCRIESLITQRKAMRFENEMRLQNNQSISYNEKDFYYISELFDDLGDSIRNGMVK